MKNIAAILFTFLIILSVNGNATKIIPIDLVLFDISSSVGENHNIGAETTSEPEIEQSVNAISEPTNMLILGVGFVIFGVFARKKLSNR